MSKELKLLLYCTKAKPYLYKTEKPMIEKKFEDYHTQLNEAVLTENLNGKVVAECDFEVEEIINYNYSVTYYTGSLNQQELLNKSCLGICKLNNYLKGENGYAIHIKNLTIFDEPKELDDYYYSRKGFFRTLGNAPQNMMYVYDNGVKKILISIQPQWMCKILNGEKTIEVRKKVLKEMLGLI